MSTLGFVYMAIPFVISLGLGILLPYLAMLMYARFEVGLVVVFGMYALESLFMDVGGLNLGITIYYTDLVLVLVGFVAFLRLLTAKDFPLRHKGWLVFCTVMLLSFALGLASYGTGAGVQVRNYFYFAAAGLYGMSFPMNACSLRKVFNALGLLGLMLVGLSLYRWAVLFIPIPDLMPEGGTYNVDGIYRVIYSYSTLVVAQVFVLGVFFAQTSGVLGPVRFMAPLLLGVVLALQHRSVWLAMLVGIAASLLVGRKKQASTATRLIMLAGIVCITALPMLMSGELSGVTQSVGKSAERAAAGRDTTGERLESWQQIIKQWYDAGPRSILIGQSFGSDMTRMILNEQTGGYRRIGYAAHNMYVQTLFNTGILGLGALLAAFGYTLRGLYRCCREKAGEVEAQALFVLLLMQAAYYVPYGVDYLQGLVFGVALSYVAGKSLRSAPQAVPQNYWQSA